MSLDFNYEKVENGEDLIWRDSKDGGEEVNPISQAIIFGLMFVDMQKITGENWKRFYHRLNAWERITGTMVIVDGEKYFVTPQDVVDHIGLSVNVIEKSDATFAKKLFEAAKDDANRDINEWDRDQLVKFGKAMSGD
jgi:hypothetical protein